MLDSRSRRSIMLHQEGMILAAVSSNGIPTTCEIARCQMDGLANALIRMDGREEAAHFMFALSDRVCGGLQDNTTWLSPVLIERIERFEEPDVDEPDPPRFGLGKQFYWGVIVGLAVMMAVTILAQGRV